MKFLINRMFKLNLYDLFNRGVEEEEVIIVTSLSILYVLASVESTLQISFNLHSILTKKMMSGKYIDSSVDQAFN